MTIPKMLTLHQPYASLIAVGAKRIETRHWSTAYRGPIVIHAAKTTATWRVLDGPSLMSERATIDAVLDALDAVWDRDPDGSPRSWVSPSIDWDGEWIDVTWHDPNDPPNTRDRGTLMPLGAAVATANLVDVVPMCLIDDPPPPADREGARFIAINDDGSIDMWEWGEACCAPGIDWTAAEDIDDERPFGLYEPGRFGWILDDVVALDEPIYCRGNRSLQPAPPEVVEALRATA